MSWNLLGGLNLFGAQASGPGTATGRSGNQPRIQTAIEPAHLALVAEVRAAAVAVANANEGTGALVSGPAVEQLAEALEAVLFYAASPRPVATSSSGATADTDQHSSNTPAAAAARGLEASPEKAAAPAAAVDDPLNEELFELGHFWELVLAANTAASSTVPHANSAGVPNKLGERPPRILPNSRPAHSGAATSTSLRDTSLLKRAFCAVNQPSLARVRTLRGKCRAFVRALLTLPPPTSTTAAAVVPSPKASQARRSAEVRNLATELDAVFKSLAGNRSALITCYAQRRRSDRRNDSSSSAGSEIKTEAGMPAAGMVPLRGDGSSVAAVAAVGSLPPPPSADEEDALVGQRVQLRGLQASPENNGTWGAALFYDATAGRYAVQLDSGGDPVMLRAVNLTSQEELASASLAAASGATPGSKMTATATETATTAPASALVNAGQEVEAPVALTPVLASEAALEALAGALATLHPLTKKRQRLWLCIDSAALDLPPSVRVIDINMVAATTASIVAEGKLAHSMTRQNLQQRSLMPWSCPLPKTEDVVAQDDAAASNQTCYPLDEGSVLPLSFKLTCPTEALGEAGAAMGGIYFEEKIHKRDKSEGRLYSVSRFTNGQGFEIFRVDVATFHVPSLRPFRTILAAAFESTSPEEGQKEVVDEKVIESLTTATPDDVDLRSNDDEKTEQMKASADKDRSVRSNNVDNIDNTESNTSNNLDESKYAADIVHEAASQWLAYSRWFLGSIQQRRAYFSAPPELDSSGNISNMPPLTGWQLAPAAAAAAGHPLPSLRVLPENEAAIAWRARCDAAADRGGKTLYRSRHLGLSGKGTSKEDGRIHKEGETNDIDVDNGDDADESQSEEDEDEDEWPIARITGANTLSIIPTTTPYPGDREVGAAVLLPPPPMSLDSEKRSETDDHSLASSSHASESEEEVFEIVDSNSGDDNRDASRSDLKQVTANETDNLLSRHSALAASASSGVGLMEPGPQASVLENDEEEVNTSAGAQPEAVRQVPVQTALKTSVKPEADVAATMAAKCCVRAKARVVVLDTLIAGHGDGAELVGEEEALTLSVCVGPDTLTAMTYKSGQTFAQALAAAEAAATAPPVSLFEEHTDTELQLSAEERFTAFVRELERRRSSEIETALKRHFQCRDKFCQRRSQLEAKGESVAGEAAALRSGLGLPPRSSPMSMAPPVLLSSSFQQTSLSTQMLSHDSSSSGIKSRSYQANLYGKAAASATHGLREGFSADRREVSVSIACTRAEAWLRRKGVDVDGDNEASAQRQRYPPTLEEVMQEVRLLKASAVTDEEDGEEPAILSSSKPHDDGVNKNGNNKLIAASEATATAVKTTHFFGGDGGSSSSDGSSSSSESETLSSSATSKSLQATAVPATVVPPPQAPVLSSKALLARLREAGRRLVWLPPEAATSELTVAEVLSGSSSSGSGSGNGQDPSDLFVLRLTRCTTEVTPLVQPSVTSSSSSSGQAIEDTAAAAAASDESATGSEGTGVRYEMEHLSRVEVATVRVPLGALEATHAAIEQSLLYLLQDRLRQKRARKQKTKHACFADHNSDQNGANNDSSRANKHGNFPKAEADEKEEERVLRVPGLPPFPATVPHVDASDVANAGANNNSNTSGPGSWFRNLGSVGLTSPGGLGFMSGGLGRGLNGSLGLGTAKSEVATRDKLVVDLNSWLAGLLALQFSPDFQDNEDDDDSEGNGEEEAFSKGAASGASNGSKGSTNRSHDDGDDDDYEYEGSVRASVSGGHSSGGRAAAQATAAAGAAEVVGAFLWQLRLLSHPPDSSAQQKQQQQYEDSMGSGGALDVNAGGNSGGAWWSAGMAALAASGGAGGLGSGSLGNVGFGNSVKSNSGSGASGNGSHGASSQSPDDTRSGSDLNFGPSGFVEVTLRVDDFNPWEIQDDSSEALNENGTSSPSRFGSGGVGLGAGGSHSGNTASKSGGYGKSSSIMKRKATAALASRSDEDQLRVQGYMCPGCGTPLAAALFAKAYAPCRYLDALFCRKTCHVDEHRILPHRVLHYWDFVPHRVCRAAAVFLDGISHVPLLDVSLLAPHLLASQPLLRNVRTLRHQLSYLRDLVHLAGYLPAAKVLQQRLAGKAHLVLDTELYSLRDLEDVSRGAMKLKLDALLDEVSQMAAKSTHCRTWLRDAERGAKVSGRSSGLVSSATKGVNGSAPQATGTRLRVEEKLLYRSLLGLGN